jgi:hypothetical protein
VTRCATRTAGAVSAVSARARGTRAAASEVTRETYGRSLGEP